MICCTRLCRTTSFSPNCTTPIPSIFPQTSSASIKPDFFPCGRSICVTSPVITALELKPRRVRNIFICSLVGFCASSRMTNESVSVRPPMKTTGATSMSPLFQQPARRFVRFLRRHAHQRLHFRRGERASMPREVVVLLHNLHGLVDAVLLAFDHQPRVMQMRAHAQRILEHTHIFIQRAEEGFNLSGDVNGTSHPIGRFSCYRNRVADGIPPVCG